MKTCEKCSKVHNGSFGSGRFCSRSCANSRTFSNESIEKKRQAALKSPPWNKGKSRTYTKVCVTCNKKFSYVGWSNRKTCSSECAVHAPGRNGGYRPNSTRKIRNQYKGYWMDSGAELQFAKLLDEHNIKWIKNTKTFFSYRDNSGKTRKYYPDFYLPGYDYWVEIKGLYYKHENDKHKLNAVGSNIELQYHNNIKLPSCI